MTDGRLQESNSSSDANKLYRQLTTTVSWLEQIDEPPYCVQVLSRALTDIKVCLCKLLYLENRECAPRVREYESLPDLVCGSLRVCEEVYLLLSDHVVNHPVAVNLKVWEPCGWSWQVDKILDLIEELREYLAALNKILVLISFTSIRLARQHLSLEDRASEAIVELMKRVFDHDHQVSAWAPIWTSKVDLLHPELSLQEYIRILLNFVAKNSGLEAPESQLKPGRFEHILTCTDGCCHEARILPEIDQYDPKFAFPSPRAARGSLFPLYDRDDEGEARKSMSPNRGSTTLCLQRARSVQGRLEGMQMHSPKSPGSRYPELADDIRGLKVRRQHDLDVIKSQGLGSWGPELDISQAEMFASWEEPLIAILSRAYGLEWNKKFDISDCESDSESDF